MSPEHKFMKKTTGRNVLIKSLSTCGEAAEEEEGHVTLRKSGFSLDQQDMGERFKVLKTEASV